MKKVILIKLGGSIITDKKTPKKANLEIINSLSKEIASTIPKTKDLFILGHGGGSFPHQSAAKFNTKEGLKNPDSLIGASQVKLDAAELNMIISKSLINYKIPVFTLPPSTFITSKNKKMHQLFTQSLLNNLESGLISVVYGDVITDNQIGFTIYSTEQILNEIALTLPLYNYETKMIIEVGNTTGVLDENNKTIPEINSKNFSGIKNILVGSGGTDVTGGMLHKVTEALVVAQKGIPTLIISGGKGNLEKAILGKKVKGTWVKN